MTNEYQDVSLTLQENRRAYVHTAFVIGVLWSWLCCQQSIWWLLSIDDMPSIDDLTHSLARSLVHSLTFTHIHYIYSSIHTFTHPLTELFTHSFTFIYPIIYMVTYSLIKNGIDHSCTPNFVYSLTTHPLIQLHTGLFTHSLTHPFLPYFTHSLTQAHFYHIFTQIHLLKHSFTH